MLRITAVATVYFIAGKFGLAMSALTTVSPVWPPSGISTAALLVFGLEAWPGVFLGGILANSLTGIPLWNVLVIGVGNVVEAVTFVLLLRYFFGRRDFFSRPGWVLLFVFGAILPAMALSALIGVTTICITNPALWSEYRVLLLTWWMGDCTGCLFLCPLILVWLRGPNWPMRRYLELAATIAAYLLLAKFVLGRLLHLDRYEFDYLALPFLMWGAFRFGFRGATLFIFLISTEATLATRFGLGPFLGDSTNESMLLLQIYVAILSVSGLVVSSILGQRDRMAEDRELLLNTLKNRTEELEESNTELKFFAWGTTHDLKEPLRTIICHLQLLERNCRQALDTEANALISLALAGAQRMHRLIEDLLAYSRAGQSGQESEWVECTDVVSDVMRNLKGSINETGAVITINPLPQLMTNRGELTQIFQNLIDNGIKYRRVSPPAIEVDAFRGRDEWVFCVRDNGIGIEALYLEKIFEAFQRLHPQNQYAGSGIGLALCKRIVERRGGRIWVESQLGVGSTVYFTLPSLVAEPLPKRSATVLRLSDFREKGSEEL